MYRQVVLGLAFGVIGCSDRSPPRDPAPAVPGLEVKRVPRHAGATALWGNKGLLLGMRRDWEKPGLIKVTLGDGDEVRTITGWVAGVVGDKAYVLVPRGSDLEVVRVGATGEPEPLATIPREAEDRPPMAAVTGTGAVVVVARSLDPGLRGDGSVVDPHGTDLAVIDGTGIRRLALAGPNEIAIALAGNPTGPEVAVVLRHIAGQNTSGHADSWIELIDTGTVTRRWDRDIVPTLTASDGEVGFGRDRVVLHHGDAMVTLDLVTAAPGVVWRDIDIDARNLVFDTGGRRVAFTEQLGVSDMDGIMGDEVCNVVVIDAGDQLFRGRPPVERFKGRCYFGIGLAWVDGALWIAAP